MTKRPRYQNGLSKKELIEIIEKIDCDQDQSEKQKTHSEEIRFHVLPKFHETR